MKTGKRTLVFSQTAKNNWGCNIAATNDGVRVEYTLNMDEKEYGKWSDSYKWPDAVLVGYIDSDKQVSHYGIKIPRNYIERNRL